jgi:hypothetical protein
MISREQYGLLQRLELLSIQMNDGIHGVLPTQLCDLSSFPLALLNRYSVRPNQPLAFSSCALCLKRENSPSACPTVLKLLAMLDASGTSMAQVHTIPKRTAKNFGVARRMTGIDCASFCQHGVDPEKL